MNLLDSVPYSIKIPSVVWATKIIKGLAEMLRDNIHSMAGSSIALSASVTVAELTTEKL
jgi:hypothetical protein